MPPMWEKSKGNIAECISQEFIKAISSWVKWVGYRIQEANMWVCAFSIKIKMVNFFIKVKLNFKWQ